MLDPTLGPAPQFALDADQIAIRDMARAFADEVIAPKAVAWDETRHFPVAEMRCQRLPVCNDRNGFGGREGSGRAFQFESAVLRFAAAEFTENGHEPPDFLFRRGGGGQVGTDHYLLRNPRVRLV